MRLHVFVILSLGAVATLSSIAAPDPLTAFSKLQSVRGSVLCRANANDPLTPPPVGSTLLIGTEVFLGPDASIDIVAPGDGEIRSLANHPGFAPDEPDYVVMPPKDLLDRERAARILGGYMASVDRGASRLFAPANGSRVRLDQPVAFRWRPGPPGETYVLAAGAKGVWSWHREVPASAGVLQADDLPKVLESLIASGARQLYVVCVPRGSTPAPNDANVIEPLPSDDQSTLNRELSSCGPDSDPLRHFLRAAAFSRVRLYTETLQELEQGVADKRNQRDITLLRPAAQFANAVGAFDLAQQWRAASDTPAPASLSD